MRPKQLAMFLGLSAVWGASFLFIKLAVRSPAAPYNFPPMTMVCVRLAVAGLLIYGLLKVRGSAFPWQRWFDLAVLGLINAALPYFLFAWGEQYIDSNLAAIYNATTPLFNVILALLIVREERLSMMRSMGVLVGFCGILYLFSDSLANIGGTSRFEVYGELACVVGSLFYAFGNMWSRRRLKDLEPMQVATGQLIFGGLWTLPIVIGVEQPWQTLAPSLSAAAALGALSIFGTGLAMVVFFRLLKEVGATRASQVTYLLPLFGLFWGSFIGEPITTRIVGALSLVLLSLLIVNGGGDWLLRRWRGSTKVSPVRY